MAAILSAQFDTGAANAFLERLNRAPLAPATLAKIGQGLLSSVRDTFYDQRSPSGVPWAALKPATLANRRRRGNNSTRILLDTLALFKSVKVAISGASVSVEVGAGLPDDRATYAQSGTNRAPPRPFFPEQGRLPESWLDRATDPIRAAWRDTRAG